MDSTQPTQILITLKIKKKQYLHDTESTTSAYWGSGLIEFFASQRILALLSETLAMNEYVLTDFFSVVLKFVLDMIIIQENYTREIVLYTFNRNNFVIPTVFFSTNH